MAHTRPYWIILFPWFHSLSHNISKPVFPSSTPNFNPSIFFHKFSRFLQHTISSGSLHQWRITTGLRRRFWCPVTSCCEPDARTGVTASLIHTVLAYHLSIMTSSWATPPHTFAIGIHFKFACISEYSSPLIYRLSMRWSRSIRTSIHNQGVQYIIVVIFHLQASFKSRTDVALPQPWLSMMLSENI